MESLGGAPFLPDVGRSGINNHGFPEGNKHIAFTAAAVFLRRNGFYIEVDGLDGFEFIAGAIDQGSMDRHEFRFAKIVDWIPKRVRPLV
ncbi:MAG: hypothetical protein DMG88_16060 [Acidobacteria bacterium]|nr:MAG: hypothetical protein DMG88_16060 [Acidobacteriota bacterium]